MTCIDVISQENVDGSFGRDGHGYTCTNCPHRFPLGFWSRMLPSHFLANIVMAYIVMPYIVMAYALMAYVLMVYMVMAYVVILYN